MEFFTINKSKCVACGTCVAECPLQIVAMDAKLRLPIVVEANKEFCINCGHCVAVCPKQAFSLASMPAESCVDLSSAWMVEPARLEEFLKARRSIRNFKEKNVDRSTIEKLIDVARYAPSGVNRQPVNWLVVYDKAKVHELASLVIDWLRAFVKEGSPFAQSLHLEKRVEAWEKGIDQICRKAPHLLIAYAIKHDITAPAAATIALTYLELAAASRGIGTCWAGYVQMAINANPNIQKFLGLSSKTNCFGAMLLGYQKYDYHRIPLRNKAHVLWK